MKRLFRKNQIIITSLAIMIIIAGYLNFTADQTTPVNQTADDGMAENIVVDAEAVSAESSVYGDISEEDLQSEQELADITSFPDEDLASVSGEAGSLDQVDTPDGENVGEAVLTSSVSASAFSASAKLNREQVRSKNEASLLEIINNTEISEDMKTEAIANLNALTDRAEKELAAEILLEAKGFPNSVVSISDESVDVIIGAAEINDAQRAQIEDIVTRKTEADVSDIVITTLNE
ncbi:MAG: SpoIIIAH-like family protein [Coprococcus sp.]